MKGSLQWVASLKIMAKRKYVGWGGGSTRNCLIFATHDIVKQVQPNREFQNESSSAKERFAQTSILSSILKNNLLFRISRADLYHTFLSTIPQHTHGVYSSSCKSFNGVGMGSSIMYTTAYRDIYYLKPCNCRNRSVLFNLLKLTVIFCLSWEKVEIQTHKSIPSSTLKFSFFFSLVLPMQDIFVTTFYGLYVQDSQADGSLGRHYQGAE